MTLDNAHAASIVAVMGAPGSGKSTSLRLALADDAPRRLVWDADGEYGREFGTVTSDPRELARIVLAAGARDPYSVVFRPRRSFDFERDAELFSRFCSLAHASGNVLVAADELADVMRPNWGPPGWLQLVRGGRKRGCRVIAASQRPATVEKSFWSFATKIRSGRLNYADDAATVARCLMVDPREVMELPPLAFIQRDVNVPLIVWGRIVWERGRPSVVGVREKKLAPGAPA